MVQSIRVSRPTTGEFLADVACTPVADVAAMVQTARTHQAAWANKSVDERAAAIGRVAHVLVARGDELVQLICDETGKPAVEALMHEVLGVANLARYFSKNAARILRRHIIWPTLFKHRISYIHYQPRGVVGVIGPWNFPMTLVWGDVLMALCAGNAVVLKPSEYTPLIGLRPAHCFVRSQH